jgi:checkpoint serine/threonine-protein kinase
MGKNWQKQKEPLQQISGKISGNAGNAESLSEFYHASGDLPEHLGQNLNAAAQAQSHHEVEGQSYKPGKASRTKVKGETTQTQTGEK